MGKHTTSAQLTSTGVSPSTPYLPRYFNFTTHFHSPASQQPDHDAPTTPHMQHLPVITHTRFGLIRFRSPLLTESLLFSLPMGTEMFHFPTFPPTTLYIQVEVAGHNSGNFKVSLFGHPRITARLPTPQGLSQVTTSFIGSWCQGIHRSHLVACRLQRCSRPLYNSQHTHNQNPPGHNHPRKSRPQEPKPHGLNPQNPTVRPTAFHKKNTTKPPQHAAVNGP